jgi:hypothetical protein
MTRTGEWEHVSARFISIIFSVIWSCDITLDSSIFEWQLRFLHCATIVDIGSFRLTRLGVVEWSCPTWHRFKVEMVIHLLKFGPSQWFFLWKFSRSSFFRVTGGLIPIDCCIPLKRPGRAKFSYNKWKKYTQVYKRDRNIGPRTTPQNKRSYTNTKRYTTKDPSLPAEKKVADLLIVINNSTKKPPKK